MLKNQRHFNHKAETVGDIFLLKTDYMYKTDPELKAIAEVSLFLLKPELMWLYPFKVRRGPCLGCTYSIFIQTAQEYASDEKRFLMDLGVAWNKLATADRWQKQLYFL